MIRLFNKIVSDIRNGKNIENYIIITLAFIISFMDIFNIDSSSWVSSVTLAILALIAFGRISDAERLEMLNSKISQVNQLRFLKEFPETLIDDMRHTSDLWIVGITLSRTINTHYALFKRKLEQGGSIKILLLEPESAATKIAAFSDRRSRKQNAYDKEIKTTLSDFCRLKEATRGNIEIKTISTWFSFGYYAMDLDTPDGKIYLEHYSFKSEDGDVPKLILTSLDGFVYSTYLAQLRNLWKYASEWDCSKESESET